ncbi:MAG: hypothetical protein II771_01825 [Clostridia bacterium]|nr:hypothetical protein [Clostridia bacterium]
MSRRGACFRGIARAGEKKSPRTRAVEEILGIPAGLRAFAVFPLGYPAEQKEQKDRFDPARIHFVG